MKKYLCAIMVAVAMTGSNAFATDECDGAFIGKIKFETQSNSAGETAYFLYLYDLMGKPLLGEQVRKIPKMQAELLRASFQASTTFKDYTGEYPQPYKSLLNVAKAFQGTVYPVCFIGNTRSYNLADFPMIKLNLNNNGPYR